VARPREDGSERGVVYVTPEMTDKELCIRILADEALRHGERIEYAALKRGDFGDASRRILAECSDAVKRAPLLVEEAGNITIPMIRGLVKRAEREFERNGTPLGLIVVDHMGLVTVPGARTEFDKVSFISAQMKQLAKTFHVPVLALSQLSRQVESRDDKRPQLSDLRQSGNIEQDADIVLFPYRAEYYLERSKPEKFKSNEAQADWEADLERARNVCDLAIAKQRNGPVGHVRLFCDMGASAFRNANQDDRQEAML
jgi:replicative DNA helicase